MSKYALTNMVPVRCRLAIYNENEWSKGVRCEHMALDLELGSTSRGLSKKRQEPPHPYRHDMKGRRSLGGNLNENRMRSILVEKSQSIDLANHQIKINPLLGCELGTRVDYRMNVSKTFPESNIG